MKTGPPAMTAKARCRLGYRVEGRSKVFGQGGAAKGNPGVLPEFPEQSHGGTQKATATVALHRHA